MGGAAPVLLLLGGALLVGFGALLLFRALNRLQRAGAFGSLYWRSFRHFPGYRLRSLRPLGIAIVGVALLCAGCLVLYVGVTSFYGDRLYHPSG